MTRHELVLKWAEILLEGQVLIFILALSAFFIWKKEISQLIKAISENGGKFSAGPVSGEINAGPQEGAMPISSNDSSEEPKNILPKEKQLKLLQRITLRFKDISPQGPNARSKYVDKIRSEYSEGWSWDFLSELLEHESMYMKFCAATLLTTKNVNINATKIANIVTNESSSLVRFRLVEALLYWSTSKQALKDEKKTVSQIISKHVEENQYVQNKINELKVITNY